VVDADVLLTGDLMNFEDGLILARKLHFHGRAMVARARQKLEAEFLEKSDRLFYIPHNELDVVDAADHDSLLFVF
jgi:hypothetical protein